MLLFDEQEAPKAGEILRAVAEHYGERAVFTTSFGAEDQVITALIASLGLRIPIATLDTGRLFEETYEVWAHTEAQYGLKIRAYVPEARELEALLSRQGPEGHRRSLEARRECCRVRKLLPLERALDGKTAWICGLRRTQSVTRSDVRLSEEDSTHPGLVKYCPLADWTEDDIRTFIRAYQVPYNALHDRGYPSIGCACCTRAVRYTEGVRDGRWWWETPDRKECGLHSRPRR